jgi:hypothetical protein
MRKSTLRYIGTWAALLLLLAGTVSLVVLSWNSRITGSFSPVWVVLPWVITSASAFYLFLLAVKKAHRQWIDDTREAESEKVPASTPAPKKDAKSPTLDFTGVARKLVRRAPENASLKDQGEALLKNLARELEIMSGIFYLKNKGTFQAISTYAMSNAPAPYEFTLGEGLTGQAARNQEVMVLNRLPEGHLEVYSGLGKAPPSYLAIVPLIHKGRTVAVIECSGYKYDPHDVENMFRIFARDLMHKLSPNLS